MEKQNKITESVKNFYESNPYPGLDEKLIADKNIKLSKIFKKPGKILFPGCGTGHGIVGMAKIRPDLEYYGIDLSKPSLSIASQLAEKYKVKINFNQGNYMHELPWELKFQYITLQGTLHHTADPKIALKNLVQYLDDDGLIHINLYGKKFHNRRFEIIEMLDILMEAEGNDLLDERFKLFRSFYKKKQRKSIKDILLDFSLRTIWHYYLKLYKALVHKINNTSGPVTWDTNFKILNQLWIDQFSNPNEKIYDIPATKELLEYANLEVVEMMSLGKVEINILPSEWKERFKNLSQWSQFRIMELYLEKTPSVNLVAKKILK
jgi:ubiquinone/menaquinone biosynthesis C-methylase UbiE